MAKKTKKPEKLQTYQLKLTQLELVHLRDLFAVSLPVDMGKTVSQALATAEDRPLVEAALWGKVSKACERAEVPLNDDAPDFIVAPTGLPPLGCFRMADSLAQVSPPDEEEETNVTSLFDQLGQPDAQEDAG